MTITNEQLSEQIQKLGDTAFEWKERALAAEAALREIEAETIDHVAVRIARETLAKATSPVMGRDGASQ